jgi:hypothetical protein
MDDRKSRKKIFVTQPGTKERDKLKLKDRSGSANLNSAISGSSGHYAGPKTVWRKGVFDGQEIRAA